MNFFAKRKARKMIQDVIRHAEHIRAYHEDLLKKSDLDRLASAIDAAQKAADGTDVALMGKQSEQLHDLIHVLVPPKVDSGIRENLEVLVVAIAVAMAFRAYYLQPFKIPTGSMEPTLNGIKTEERTTPYLSDRYPIKLVKWLVTGEWYKEIRVRESGRLEQVMDPGVRVPPGKIAVRVGAQIYKIPRGPGLQFKYGDSIRAHDIIWSGVETAGDHVFVNKLIWNFRKPRLGEVMVFETHNIAGISEGSHYIKRLCGRPGDEVAIKPPDLLINGERVTHPATIVRIEERQGKYAGYELAFGVDAQYLTVSTPEIRLQEGQYLALGDNTGNSRDSRYWGPVPEKNLVGPGAFVYWPFSARWGVIE